MDNLYMFLKYYKPIIDTTNWEMRLNYTDLIFSLQKDGAVNLKPVTLVSFRS